MTRLSAGLAVAFATFCVFDALVLLRVNLFLDELTGRADWQNMVLRFRASDSDNLRLFVNLDYVKIGVASAIGALMGAIGGSLGRLRHRTNGRGCMAHHAPRAPGIEARH